MNSDGIAAGESVDPVCGAGALVGTEIGIGGLEEAVIRKRNQ